MNLAINVASAAIDFVKSNIEDGVVDNLSSCGAGRTPSTRLHHGGIVNRPLSDNILVCQYIGIYLPLKDNCISKHH
jgi:hypothetical protein